MDQRGITALPLREPDSSGLPQRVAQAIKTAATQTGSSFAYLLKKAGLESGFDPKAEARTSSATGLFQFTSQTWLQMIKTHGEQYGLSDYADHIEMGSNGIAHVNDPAWRQAILDLRKDPQISAVMTCELDKVNGQKLQESTGGNVGPTELYLAHFLGASGASTFLNALRVNPNARAADILPKAANANPSIFYNASGQSRSVAQIYQHFAQEFSPAPENPILAVPSAGSPSLPAIPQVSSAATLAAIASNYGLPSASSVSTHLNPEAASLLGNTILERMNLASLAATLSSDESEAANAISVLV